METTRIFIYISLEHRLAQNIVISVSVAYLLYSASMHTQIRLGPCCGRHCKIWEVASSASQSFYPKKINPKILQTPRCCIYVNASDTTQKFINVLCCSDYCIIYYTNIYFHSVRNLIYYFIYSLEQNKNIRLA